MNEHVNEEEISQKPSAKDADVISMIKKIQEQLGFLERKIDTLLQQSSEKPFQKKLFDKPFRPFNRSKNRVHRDDFGRDRSRDRDRERGGHFDKPKDFDRSGGGERRESHLRKRKMFFRPGGRH